MSQGISITVASSKDPSQTQRVLLDDKTFTLTQLKRQLNLNREEEVILVHNGRVISDDHCGDLSSDFDLRSVLTENSVVFLTYTQHNHPHSKRLDSFDHYGLTDGSGESKSKSGNDVSHSVLAEKALFRKIEHSPINTNHNNNDSNHDYVSSMIETDLVSTDAIITTESDSSQMSVESMGSDTVQAMVSRMNSTNSEMSNTRNSSLMMDHYLKAYERYLRHYEDYRRRYAEMCLRHSLESYSSQVSLNPGWYPYPYTYPYPYSQHPTVTPAVPINEDKSKDIPHSSSQATRTHHSCSHPTVAPTTIAPPIDPNPLHNGNNAGQNNNVNENLNANNLAPLPEVGHGLGVFAEAAALERAAADSANSQRSIARRFVTAIGWLFQALQISVIIRLALFLYLFGQNVTETQWYSLTLFCIGYYIFKLGALQNIYYFVMNRINQRGVRVGNVNAPNIGADGEIIPPIAQPNERNPAAPIIHEPQELDENGAEIVRVRLLSTHELIHRFFCGLLASFYPEWHYSIWYPAPPMHTEIDPSIADQFAAENEDEF